MKAQLIYLVVVLIMSSCSHRVVDYSGKGKRVFKTVSNRGYKFYRIKDKKFLTTESEIGITCNDYITGVGATYSIYKYVYLPQGEYQHFILIKDSIMLRAYFDRHILDDETIPYMLSQEEIMNVSKLLTYFPQYAKEYNIDIRDIQEYMGWYEIL